MIPYSCLQHVVLKKGKGSLVASKLQHVPVHFSAGNGGQPLEHKSISAALQTAEERQLCPAGIRCESGLRCLRYCPANAAGRRWNSCNSDKASHSVDHVPHTGLNHGCGSAGLHRENISSRFPPVGAADVLQHVKVLSDHHLQSPTTTPSSGQIQNCAALQP